MPNTPALVGLGAAAIAGGATASDDDLEWAEAELAYVFGGDGRFAAAFATAQGSGEGHELYL